jgi:tetratricopeptide (TPR) repeat protein
VLQLLNRGPEAAEIMKKALPLGSMIEIHQYGRQLLGMKMYKDAFDAFKLNAEKNPNQFTTYMGLTRGYSGLGDFKNALKNAQLALPLAPNQQNKTAVEGMVEKLKAGKDVN